MPNLLSVVMNNLTSGLRSEGTISASLSLTDYISVSLDISKGEQLLLNLGDNGKLLLATSTGEQTEIPSSSLKLDNNVTLTEPAVIKAKITAVEPDNLKLQIQTINQQPPKQYINNLPKSENISELKSVLIKDLSGYQNIPLKSINIAEIAASYTESQPLSPEQKAEVQTALKALEVEFKLSRISPSDMESTPSLLQQDNAALPLLSKISSAIEQLPDKLINSPQSRQAIIIENMVHELKNELMPLVGKTFPAVANTTETEIYFSSSLGNITPRQQINLPEVAFAEIEIANIILSSEAKEISLQTLPEKIWQSLQKIKTESPEIYEKVAARLPADNEHMLLNMRAFVKAATNGDIKEWLGNDLIEQLENSGPKAQQVLSELQSALQSGNKQTTPIWRVIEIPYYVENRIDSIRLAIKQYPEDEDNDSEMRKKIGTRFVVDTNFTRLGAFQFDGFSIAKERRFDLIIRTENNVGDDLCAEIMRLFKTSLNEVGYVGNLKINLKENFIKISENGLEDKFLSQDLFV